jgi:hypothetical protein
VDAERELSQHQCMAELVHGMRVKLRENIYHQWIIVPSENEHIAWSGTRWVPINRDGLSASYPQALTFATVNGATSYAPTVGFEIEHG